MINSAINALVKYGMERDLIKPVDKSYVINQILEVLRLDSYEDNNLEQSFSLQEILSIITDYAVASGIIEDSIVFRDLFDTKIMGCLVPYPHEVIDTFNTLYKKSPKDATDWYYEFSQNTDYIRKYRIEKDLRWTAVTDYGKLDISINLSKPEKDPKAIAAAKLVKQSSYPKCMLCHENEGYAGKINHPARQNHRVIPLTIDNESWYFQYSPYVYYNEHCIVFNEKHIPMIIR